mgnify:FL=1
MSNAVVSAFKNKQLRKKLLFTTLILIVVRFGSQLPIPEIDSAQISAYLKSTLGDSFSLLNSFTGGSFMQMSVFALSVTPYITSSIIMQLMTIVIPALEEMQKEWRRTEEKEIGKDYKICNGCTCDHRRRRTCDRICQSRCIRYRLYNVYHCYNDHCFNRRCSSGYVAWRTYYREWNWKWYFHYPARKHCIRNAGRFYFSL